MDPDEDTFLKNRFVCVAQLLRSSKERASKLTIWRTGGLQGTAKRWSLGLVNFVIALAYHFCLALPVAFTQPGDHLAAVLCMGWWLHERVRGRRLLLLLRA